MSLYHCKQPCQSDIINIFNWGQVRPLHMENTIQYQKQRRWNLTSRHLRKKTFKQNFHSPKPEETHASSHLSDTLSHRRTWQTHNCLLHLLAACTKAALRQKKHPRLLEILWEIQFTVCLCRVLSFQ